MSKKVIIITSIIFTLLIVGLLVVAYLVLREGEKTPLEALRDALPFGGPSEEIITIRPPVDVSIPDEEFEFDELGNIIIPLLRQLTSLPIAGATSLTDEDGAVKVRYVDRASGNVHEIAAAGVKRTRLTNTTIPAVMKVFWSSDGQSLILQYLDDISTIKSFSAQIITEAEGEFGKLEGLFLEDNIKEVTVSPDGEQVFYLTEFGESIIGITADFDGSNKKQIFEHPLKQWLVEWLGSDNFSFTTKPSFATEGSTFLFNKNVGSLNRTTGGLRGLTVLYSPNLIDVIIAENIKEQFRTRLFNRDTNDITLFPLTVLPEKCLWSTEDTVVVYCGAPEAFPRGDYPDGWYKGEFSFTDDLWRINIETREVSFLVSPQDFSGVEIDVINLFLSSDEDYLFFTNKKDGTLWSLRLSE